MKEAAFDVERNHRNAALFLAAMTWVTTSPAHFGFSVISLDDCKLRH
jgi:hypothetical protein